MPRRLVSIPFIAGQWSLHFRDGRPAGRPRVSIPFIAGQWSLLLRRAGRIPRDDVFQSPSLRGSGRFLTWGGAARRGGARFNPLHCGAVVASGERPGRRLAPGRPVSIPFIAGQWSLQGPRGRLPRHDVVSIPFIAGQWSLPGIALGRPPVAVSFNPLHCGAVVASRVEGPV